MPLSPPTIGYPNLYYTLIQLYLQILNFFNLQSEEFNINSGILQRHLGVFDCAEVSKTAFVKHNKSRKDKSANYEISKKRKYQKDIGRIENMTYDKEKDVYICKNEKELPLSYVRHSKSKTGYVSEKHIYQSTDCKGCPYKSDCIKGNNCKTPMEERNKALSVAKTFLKYRQEDLERILTEEGILLRINRSIQAEGSFGNLKQNMQFRRYLSRGSVNVLGESVLLAMAKNLNKLHHKIQKGKTGTHLCSLKIA